MTTLVASPGTCLSDNETRVDLLNNEAIAATIIKLLLEHPERPITVGVHGDWGAGKSSVLEMIEAGLNDQKGVLCFKFNGWRFQGFEDAKIALLEGIVTGLMEKRPALTKGVDKVKAVFRRIDWLKVAKSAGSLAATAITGIPPIDQVRTAVATIQTMVSDPAKRPPKEQIDAAFTEAYSLIKPADQSKNVPEEIGEFRRAFDELLVEAQVNRLVVLIDDLDRCLPDTAIETLEAVRLFVFTSRTAFVVAADEAMIEYAVRKHFPDLPDTTGPQTYARNYLEKLIQVPFRIPPLGVTETRAYVTLLLIGAELGDGDPDFEKLIATARERLRRPWMGVVLDSGTIRTALGTKADRAQTPLLLSDQIGPILANGTKGNPRQIKRFLNTLILRHRTADARGFGDDVRQPVLAKLMLAERFLNRLFDQVASSAAASPDGICRDLEPLEEAARKPTDTRSKAKPDDSKRGKDKAAPTPDSPQLVEWLSSQAVLDWAAIEPTLADLDLRPYLFVTKDRKDYLGAASVLGQLAVVAEHLLGAKITVQALEPELKRLAVPEASQVFEAVRGRIIGTDDFDTEPPGAAGLEVLVKAHPELQKDLLDFLESLPADRLGPWAVTGWQAVIKDPEMAARFNKLLQSWAARTKNPFLKGAAENALRVAKEGR